MVQLKEFAACSLTICSVPAHMYVSQWISDVQTCSIHSIKTQLALCGRGDVKVIRSISNRRANNFNEREMGMGLVLEGKLCADVTEDLSALQCQCGLDRDMLLLSGMLAFSYGGECQQFRHNVSSFSTIYPISSVLFCLRSHVMAPVSFVGALVNATSNESCPDNWYPGEERRHPPWPRIEKVLAAVTSSR